MFFRYLLDMFQLILAPRRGWEDIAVDDIPSRILLTRGFVPFVIVTALSSLLSMAYHFDTSLASSIGQMIACGVKYVASYYLASFFFSLYVPSCTGGEMSLNKNHTFIIYSLTLLVLLNLIGNCLPMVPDMLYLLPVYVLFIMWRGINYMEVKFDGVIGFMALCLLAVILPPFLLQYLFNLVIAH